MALLGSVMTQVGNDRFSRLWILTLHTDDARKQRRECYLRTGDSAIRLRFLYGIP